MKEVKAHVGKKMHSEHSQPPDAFWLRRHGVGKSPETTECVMVVGEGGSEEWESSNS